MNRYMGADPEAMRDLASMVSRRSDALHDLEGRLRALISMTSWTGEDADHFRTEWSFRTRTALLEAAYDLRRRGLHLARQADEQDAASAPDAMGGVIGAGGGGRWIPAHRGEPRGVTPRDEAPRRHVQPHRDTQGAPTSSAVLGDAIGTLDSAGTLGDRHPVMPWGESSGAQVSAEIAVLGPGVGMVSRAADHALWTDPSATRG